MDFVINIAEFMKECAKIVKCNFYYKNRLVCASCVLFGNHKKHDILSLRDSAEYLRERVHEQLKKGTLKKEFTETHLLEIREYNLRLEKYKNDTVKKIDDIFKEMIATLKLRKNELITEILNKFSIEKNKILDEEQRWKEKQEISESLLSLMNDPEDKNILINSKSTMEGLRKLNERLNFKEIKVFNDLETSIKIESSNIPQEITLSHEEIIFYLSHYIRMAEPNILEFKA